MSLADIITADKQDALGQDLRASGFAEAANIIDALIDFARDEIYNLDDVMRASRKVLAAEDKVHRMYPNTATCASGPNVVSGHAMTMHCAIVCNKNNHSEDRLDYQSAIVNLKNILEAVNVP